MNWQEIREKYPHRWVVVEALDGCTEGEHRIINKLIVVSMFEDNWKPAWEHYELLHRTHKNREYYVLHTDRPELNIGVLYAFGRGSE